VRLVVSTGTPMVDVPDVRWKSVRDARRILQDAGLKVRVIAPPVGNVLRQDPAAGERVEAGTRITIYGL
jgi:serine/threonine-protein kinase